MIYSTSFTRYLDIYRTQYLVIRLLATRPLLRQIENLQHSYGTQQTSWEKLEKNLTERLGMQTQRNSILEPAISLHKAKNAKVATNLLTSCDRLVINKPI